MKRTTNQSRHDHFFKHHFSHQKTVSDFLQGQLAPDLLALIELSTLKKKEEMEKDGVAFCAEWVLSKQPKGDMKSIVGDVVRSLENAAPCCREETYAYLTDYNQGGEEEVLDEIIKFDPVEGNKHRIMFERAMKKYEQRGLERGLERGLQKGLQESLQKMVASGMSEEEVKKILYP